MREKFHWIKFSLINFSIVAILGVLMRYKIAFEFPYFDQKNIQHAHSHFAFYGWLTHTLMSLIVLYLFKNEDLSNKKKYKQLISFNLICSYGMLVAFAMVGYNAFSIFFSVSAVIISYIFTVSIIKYIRKTTPISTIYYWFIAALLFNVLASFGTFALAFMMATKHLSQHEYLAAVYFYLHFQYNGWFFFASMGLLNLYLSSVDTMYKNNNKTFWMFCLSLIPAYFLSTLWMQLPLWIYVFVVIASSVQLIAWFSFLKNTVASFKKIKSTIPSFLFYLFILVAISLTIKFVLQLGSVVPFISKLAFGFRPIVIAYLHLILLAVISIFLITFLFANKLLLITKTSKIGMLLLVTGVYTTEIVLAIQGIASFSYIPIPYINETLFIIALIILTGILLVTFSIKKSVE